jgi:hypothetical protein
MTEKTATYNPGYDDAEFAQRAKAAKIRDAIAKLTCQGVSLEEVAQELEKMLMPLKSQISKTKT